MAKLLKPEKKVLLLQAHPVNMHEEVTEWLSELEFCKVELVFLSKLLDKAFLRTAGKQNISTLESLDKKIKLFRERTLRQISKEIISHEKKLSLLDINKFAADEKALIREHKKQGMGVRAFRGAIRKIKGELYSFVEGQMRQVKKIKNDYEEGHLTL